VNTHRGKEELAVRTCRALTLTCAVAAGLLAGPAGPALAAPAKPPAGPMPASFTALGRQTLPANDGWAAATTGTTGGSAADAAHVFTVANRSELVAALGGNNASNDKNSTPKIIYIRGTVDANVDDANQPLSCESYQTGGYTLAAYLATYDPAVWGRTTEPSGPLEDARAASAANQTLRVKIKVGPNTTLIGLPGARLLGADLTVNKVDNVIIRNLTFEHAFDCFPQWDPTDGATGAWNSLYDNISLTGATHLWLDHNTFTDGSHPDSQQPSYFGSEFQQHDGEFDVTSASDLVTAEWNVFTEHDKTNLIGSSNTSTADVGKLRITFHHNLWSNTLQRAPRVRFGQVHVYNNLYVVPGNSGYIYSWGVGVQSAIFAEQNFFVLGRGVTADKVIFNWGGTDIHEAGNLVNGRPVNLLAAFNAANPSTPIGSTTTWTPTLHTRIDPAWLVPLTVALGAGANHLR
jgi:pectate lyase